MTTPSGQISLSDVNLELSYSGTATISMNDTNVRTLAGVASGTISMSNLQGKSWQFSFNIASNQVQADLRTLAINAGWNQSAKLYATINSGVYIYSNSTGSAALTVSGSFPNGVWLTNNGVILARGGDGGRGGLALGYPTVSNGVAGGGGGTALVVSTAVDITNNNIISGGGGGGGGGGNFSMKGGMTVAGGGGGGGIGGSAAGLSYSASYNGTAGSLTSAGTGGAGFNTYSGYRNPSGGNGGGYGSAGGVGYNGGPGGYYYIGGAGGGAGACTSGNGYITWSVAGSRYGALN